MATKLDKPIFRETDVVYQKRAVIVGLYPRGPETALPHDVLEFRLKGTQQNLRAPLADVFRFVRGRGLAGAGGHEVAAVPPPMKITDCPCGDKVCKKVYVDELTHDGRLDPEVAELLAHVYRMRAALQDAATLLRTREVLPNEGEASRQRQENILKVWDAVKALSNKI